MLIRLLLQVFPKYVVSKITDLFQDHSTVIISGIGNKTSKAIVTLKTWEQVSPNSTLLWCTNSIQELDELKKELSIWTNTEIAQYRILDNTSDDKKTHRQNLGNTLNLIANLQENKKQIILTTYEDLLFNTPVKKDLEELTWHIKVDDEYSLVSMFEKLIDMNFQTATDPFLSPGEYFCRGNLLTIYPHNLDYPIRVTVDFDEISQIDILDHDQKTLLASVDSIGIYPIIENQANYHLNQFFQKNNFLVFDELEVAEDNFKTWDNFSQDIPSKLLKIHSFNEDEENHTHLPYTSILKFHSIADFIKTIKDKKQMSWKIILATKNETELKNILKEHKVVHNTDLETFAKNESGILLFQIDEDLPLPNSFQNIEQKIILITDKDIAKIGKKEKKSASSSDVYLDLVTSLKPRDLVVHTDHGIGRFQCLIQKTISGITKEYIELAYAQNDKLFVPIDQADRISKYIGSEENAPKLTRLGSSEWATVNKKVKKEAQKIAKELLKIFAAREAAPGVKFEKDNDLQDKFEDTFPYEETPGQIKAIIDVKKDMESPQPMDRLVCGDVGFGKTEVAMRAAFKAVQSGKQVAFISPITILADQHYKSFKKRMDKFHVRIEMLSRFKTKAEQKEIIERTKKGEVDIVIGTHRLLQKDIEFKNLGLVMVDEEQRFGVKQKETLKEMRAEVDILTLTATPIPRTLNMSLNKLRDITTITTPPPGRLPVITEVRKYSEKLIEEAIRKELQRGGQVYLLHNRVQTIDTLAAKLHERMPDVRFVVAHGQLTPQELEKRILAFKEGKYDVLISSTIIENGIDLPNANTLIVNKAEKFGLSQLYQLRGRVGRGKSQAYAYFLYHGRRLKLDARKRLKAIVEASELGSGFQIAMKDLEIRGAGEILGANQSGTMQVVGVSHFIRMLNKAVDDLKAGRTMEDDEETAQEVSIELPVNAYIPDTYIPSSKDKISYYQKLSAANDTTYLSEIKEDMEDEFGRLPNEVHNLLQVIELKIHAKNAQLQNIKSLDNRASAKGKQIILTLSKQVKPTNIISLLNYNEKWEITGTKLKINLEYLGAHWFQELINSVEALSQKVEPKSPSKKSQ